MGGLLLPFVQSQQEETRVLSQMSGMESTCPSASCRLSFCASFQLDTMAMPMARVVNGT